MTRFPRDESDNIFDLNNVNNLTNDFAEYFYVVMQGFPPSTNCMKLVITSTGEFFPEGTAVTLSPMDSATPGPMTI